MARLLVVVNSVILLLFGSDMFLVGASEYHPKCGFVYLHLRGNIDPFYNYLFSNLDILCVIHDPVTGAETCHLQKLLPKISGFNSNRRVTKSVYKSSSIFAPFLLFPLESTFNRDTAVAHEPSHCCHEAGASSPVDNIHVAK